MARSGDRGNGLRQTVGGRLRQVLGDPLFSLGRMAMYCAEWMTRGDVLCAAPQSSGWYCAGCFVPRLLAREKHDTGGTS
ncbi:hypothetical protein CBM2633_B11151 [Cupriavidus taiwanensis]|nr:hypothetical protein CBM2604_B10186 [Cupriavidus taiwanensis]SOZ29988.1 hypothetical protein CBM2609_B10187 [Cupriavidus taiwanensis]SOZ47033.1 hypothetical protein CBM2610_B10186 [Cupriavidus taiwanensis]SOZ67914.1 hypothetical protein CBM2614_B30018 [Cupriavidus taiwanensis]SOZ68880.1 hypothetical protein CBM2615_B30020 [Cupriavidus taiwanensis]